MDNKRPDYPGTYGFPDEYAPASKKEKAPYGLQAAKAMYYSQNRFGYRLFNRDEKIDALFELAQGRNSTDNIRKMFGFHDDQNSTQDDQGALAYIDIQTINLATSYVNRAVAKLQRNKYEIGLSAIDPLSVDEAKQQQAKLATYYLLKDWMATNNLDPQKFFPDLDIPNLPNYPDELLFQLSTNIKIQKVIDGEKTIKLVNNVINDIQQQLRECDWDLVVAGRAHLHCYLDENFMPRVERVNPKFWGGSYVDNEDYSKAEYQFFVEFITKNQFKKEAEDKLTKEEIETVLGSFTYANAITSVGTLPEYYQFYDGLDYIPVMRFYFLSNDARSYARWKNDSGYLMIDERKPDWKPSQDATTKREVIRTNVTSVYGGTWVIDSDIVYDYGRRSIPRTNLVNTRLPIITFAPNMKNGRVVSLLAQMVEPLTMFNVAWNKAKDILAKGRMNVWELNLTAFENVALGKGGQAWTPREAMDFLFQTNMAVTRQNTNQYGQSNGQAVREMASGLQLADYFTTMSNCVMILDKLTASSVVEQGQIPDRLAVGAMKASIAAGTEGVEYLINGHRQLYQQATHMLLLLTQEAKRNKIAIQGMIPALGTFTTEYFEVPDTLPYCEYGLMMETEPTEEEWMMFYSEIQVAVQEGRLNSSDSAFIRQIKNLKQARFIMANRERINERKAQEMRAQEQQFQTQLQDKTAQDKLNLEMQILEKKKQDETELIALKGKIDEYLQNNKLAMEAEMNKSSDTIKQMIAKQQGIDSIIEAAMYSKTENYKSDKKLQGDIMKAEKQAETAIKTASMNKDKKKEKATTK